jgi:hypothetical protein
LAVNAAFVFTAAATTTSGQQQGQHGYANSASELHGDDFHGRGSGAGSVAEDGPGLRVRAAAAGNKG